MSAIAGHELDAAGITDPSLRDDYRQFRRLNSAHGKTYYLATLLLPPARRPAVHALYGFARWIDDVIDEDTGPVGSPAQQRLLDGVADMIASDAAPVGPGDSQPVVRALKDTVRRWDLPASHLLDFVESMRMDLTVTEYATYADLEKYMWGSAAVIGLLMLPVLGTVAPIEVAAPYAVDLGIAFQLTNFLRDVGDDLRRGRIYLPQDSLRHHGVDRARLERGVIDGPIRRLLADEIARTRELYRSAAAGVRLLHPTSRDCVRTALLLYGAILDEIEGNDYRVLDRRVRVPRVRRLSVAGPAAIRAVAARRRR